MNQKRWMPVLLALALATGAAGCTATPAGEAGGNSVLTAVTLPAETATPEATPEPTPEPTPEVTPEVTPEATPEAKSGYGVGEQGELDGISVTLTEVEESQGNDFFKPEEGKVFLICHFDIANNSEEDLSVSSILSFDAYVDDYSTSMSLNASVASSDTQLDGTVAAGKKMAGIIGYEAPVDWSTLEITFTPDLLSRESMTFFAEKG